MPSVVVDLPFCFRAWVLRSKRWVRVEIDSCKLWGRWRGAVTLTLVGALSSKQMTRHPSLPRVWERTTVHGGVPSMS
jgi:hypothetical protein